jgi:ADP-ribose pyrophosphatase YjhB (NUDIX family)
MWRKAGDTVPAERQRSLAPRRGETPKQPARRERQRETGIKLDQDVQSCKT